MSLIKNVTLLLLFSSLVDSFNENLVGSHVVEDNVYWSSKIESIRPNGFTDQQILDWIDSLKQNSSKFTNVKNDCGRMKNRLLIIENGQQICARFRRNNEQILGEYYSFLLARMLEIGNVLPTTLSVYEANDQWNNVWKTLQNEAHWEQSKPVVLTRFIDDLKPSLIPKLLRGRNILNKHLIANELENLNLKNLKELIQWSDLIVFDYLTANTDRVVNNVVNRDWNPEMMNNPAHNLLKHSHDELLIFLDNESGLFHGYRLLDRYEKIHHQLLESVCLFRRQTIKNMEAIARLNSNQLSKLFWQYFQRFSSLSANKQNYQFHLPMKNLKILQKRIEQVLKHVQQCQQRF